MPTLEEIIDNAGWASCDTFTEEIKVDAKGKSDVHGKWARNRPTVQQIQDARTLMTFGDNGECASCFTLQAGEWLEVDSAQCMPIPGPLEESAEPMCAPENLYLRRSRVNASGQPTGNASLGGLTPGRADFEGGDKLDHRAFLIRMLKERPGGASGLALFLEGRDATFSKELCEQVGLPEAQIIVPNPDPYVCHCIKQQLPDARIFCASFAECLERLSEGAVGQVERRFSFIWADFCGVIDKYGKDVRQVFARRLPADRCVFGVTYSDLHAEWVDSKNKKQKLDAKKNPGLPFSKQTFWNDRNTQKLARQPPPPNHEYELVPFFEEYGDGDVERALTTFSKKILQLGIFSIIALSSPGRNPNCSENEMESSFIFHLFPVPEMGAPEMRKNRP